MWHAGDTEGTEWDVPVHITMHSGSVLEETSFSGGGGEGGHRQGFQRLWAPTGDGNLLQIPRTGDIVNGRRLDKGGKEIGPDKDGV